MGLKV
jgi:DNA-binding HxlR family transcriptional regulator